MEFSEQLAREIIEKFKLAPTTIKTWKHRGEIPDEYFQENQKVSLRSVLSDSTLNARIEKYGSELEKLLDTRTFKAGQNESYYMTCLRSLCSELV